MRRFGEHIGSLCCGGEVIYLTGQLGAGKTVLSQAIAATLGVRSVVTSPTFIILNQYDAKNGLELAHADLYRVHSVDDVTRVGLPELLLHDTVVAVVEWAENVPELEHYPHLHLTFDIVAEERTVRVEQHGHTPALDNLYKGLHNAHPLS